jgi:hypothetical protein
LTDDRKVFYGRRHYHPTVSRLCPFGVVKRYFDGERTLSSIFLHIGESLLSMPKNLRIEAQRVITEGTRVTDDKRMGWEGDTVAATTTTLMT